MKNVIKCFKSVKLLNIQSARYNGTLTIAETL